MPLNELAEGKEQREEGRGWKDTCCCNAGEAETEMQPKYNVLILHMLYVCTCVAVYSDAFQETTTQAN